MLGYNNPHRLRGCALKHPCFKWESDRRIDTEEGALLVSVFSALYIFVVMKLKSLDYAEIIESFTNRYENIVKKVCVWFVDWTIGIFQLS